MPVVQPVCQALLRAAAHRVAGAVGVGEGVEEGVQAALHQLHKRLLRAAGGARHSTHSHAGYLGHACKGARACCRASRAGAAHCERAPGLVGQLARWQTKRSTLHHQPSSRRVTAAQAAWPLALMGYLRLPHSTECSRMWGTPRLLATGVLHGADQRAHG